VDVDFPVQGQFMFFPWGVVLLELMAGREWWIVLQLAGNLE